LWKQFGEDFFRDALGGGRQLGIRVTGECIQILGNGIDFHDERFRLRYGIHVSERLVLVDRVFEIGDDLKRPVVGEQQSFEARILAVENGVVRPVALGRPDFAKKV